MTERKIESLGNWSNDACLHAVLEQIKPDDSLIVIVMDNQGNGNPTHWNANLTFGDAVFMLEATKHRMIKAAYEGNL
jgi:hypothetical protein